MKCFWKYFLILCVLVPIPTMAISGCGGQPGESESIESQEASQDPEEEPLADPNDPEGLEPSGGP